MLGFACGRMTVSLIFWALWSYDCQFDILGFVAVRLLDGCNSDLECVYNYNNMNIF